MVRTKITYIVRVPRGDGGKKKKDIFAILAVFLRNEKKNPLRTLCIHTHTLGILSPSVVIRR